MKALVYEGDGTLTIREMPDPEPVADERLVRIEAVGICGSDMHAYLGHDARRPPPQILGHEAAGTIVGDAGAGRRVTINPLVTCGTCPACRSGRENLCPSRQIISMAPRPGAFAQFVAIPERNLIDVPAEVPLDRAALAEPLAVSWHAVRLALTALHADAEPRALVIGGGAIGLAAAQSLQAMGCADVTIAEPNKARSAFLESFCSQRVVSSGEGQFPIVVDAVGYEATREAASALVEPGGVITHIGLGEDRGGLDVRRMTLQEITFIGAYTYTAQDFRETAAAMFAGRLGKLDWFETRALDRGAGAFRDLLSGSVAVPKIILTPWP